jgi:23S rRNA (guanosine2251-2'-O)-methyltransferase
MSKKSVDENNSNLIYGRNPVLAYLQSEQTVDQILFHAQIRKNDWFKNITKLARQQKVRYSFVPKDKLNSLTGPANHQGVVAFVSPVSYCSVEDILHFARQKNEPPFIVVLDGLQDPHNFGAIIRTSVAAGVHGIVIPKHGSVSVTNTVVKTSAGTVHNCKIARETNLVQTIEKLKKEDIWIYGAEGNGEKDIFNTDFRGSVAIVLGGEGSGLHQKVKEHCDFLVKIPMVSRVESLNVSVSAGLMIYKVFESRQ